MVNEMVNNLLGEGIHMPNPVRDRKELRNELEKSLLSINELATKDPANRPKFKTFIIESNVENPAMIENAQIQKTSDESLNMLYLKDRLFYVDSADKRFWLIYTIEKSFEATNILQDFIDKEKSMLDNVWFSSNNLMDINSKGKPFSFGVKYENRFLEDKETESAFEDMSMQVRGGNPQAIISLLKENPNTQNGVRISRVGIKIGDDLREEISFNGKFLIRRGIDIQSHFDLLKDVRDYYKEIINKVEGKYRVYGEYNETFKSFSVKGNTLTLEFAKPLENLDAFCDVLFSGSEPFKLLGVKYMLDDGYYKIFAVDLHSYHKITIELWHEYMRIYLARNTCGNVITRLYANLERYFQPNIKLYGADDERIV